VQGDDAASAFCFRRGGKKMGKETVSLVVEGMSCSHCEDSVIKAVSALNGVSGVSVDLKIKRVIVEYDGERVSIQTIRDTIEDQGYEVRDRG
jgi:copper chaperone